MKHCINMNFHLLLVFSIILLSGRNHCHARSIPEEVIPRKSRSENQVRAEEGGASGLQSAVSNFGSGFSTLMNTSNMKESKLVMGGFSFVIIPSPDMAQLSQLNGGQLPQMPSLPGKK